MLLQLLMGPGGKRKKPKSLLARGAHDPPPLLPTQYRGYTEGRRTHEPLPPDDKWEKMDWVNAKGAEIYTELLARAIGATGHGTAYSTAKNVIKYGFQDVDAEGKKDILKWMGSLRSYSEMPPGAMPYILIEGMLPIIGGVQAGQDVLRDVMNDEVSGFTLLDALSVPLEALPLVPLVTRIVRHTDDFVDLGKAYKSSKAVRSDPRIPDPEAYVPPKQPAEMPDDIPGAPEIEPVRPAPEPVAEPTPPVQRVFDNDFTRARAKNPELFDQHVVQTDNPEFADFLLRDGSMYMKANDMEMHDDILRRIGLGGLPTFQARGGVRITDGYAVELGGVKITPAQRKVIMDLADINEAAGGGMLIDAQQEGLKVVGLGGDALEGPTMTRGNVARALNDIEENDVRLLDEPPEPGQRPQGVADTLEDARAGLKTEPEEIDVFAGEPQHTGGMTGGMKTESKKFMDADEARRYKPAVRWQNRAPGDDSWVTGINHSVAGRMMMKQDVDLPFENQYGFMERGFEVTDPETGKTKFMSSEDAQADQMARRNAEDPKSKNILQRLWEDESGEVRIPMPGLGGDTPARATGRGADALHRAYDETLVVTDVDRQIAEAVNAPGFQGGTWTLEGKEPPASQRYIVSPQKDTETVFFGDVTGEDVAAFRRAHQEEFSKKGYVGSWRRSSDGRLVTDVSRGFRNRKDAMAVAMTGDQEAVFDRRTFGEIANPHYDKVGERTIWPDQKTAADARNRTLDAIPHWGEASDAAMIQFMDPATRDWYLNANKGAQRRTREAFRKSMTPEETAAVIALGEQTIGWYENAATSLRQMFGEDAYQFGAVLAATSPQVPVSSNTRYTLDLWGEWVRGGRTDDPEAIRKLIHDTKAGLNENGIDTHNVIPSAFENNVIEILSHKDPIGYYGDPKTWATPGAAMSGLKVDPFFSNVMGNLTRATIDTHILDAMGAPELSLSRRAGMTAALNAGGAKLMDDLGLPPHILQTAQNQEALWEPTRQVKEMVARGELTPALFTDGELDMAKFAALNDRMKQSEDFSQILAGEEAARLLRDTGHNVDLQVPHRKGLGPLGEDAQRYATERPDELKAWLERLGLARKLKGENARTSDPRWILGIGGGLLGAGAGQALRRWQDSNAEQPLPPGGQQGLLSGGPFLTSRNEPAASPLDRGLFDL